MSTYSARLGRERGMEEMNNAIRHDMMMDCDDGTYCAHTNKTKNKHKQRQKSKREGKVRELCPLSGFLFSFGASKRG